MVGEGQRFVPLDSKLETSSLSNSEIDFTARRARGRLINITFVIQTYFRVYRTVTLERVYDLADRFQFPNAR